VIIEVSKTVCSLIKTAVVESTNNDPFCWTPNRISRKKCKTKSMRKWAVLLKQFNNHQEIQISFICS